MSWQNRQKETPRTSARIMKQCKNHADNLNLQQETFHQNLACSRILILLNLKLFKMEKPYVIYFWFAVLIHYKATSVILETFS